MRDSCPFNANNSKPMCSSSARGLPASSCALHLANLIKRHNASGAKPELSAENIYVLEKGREIGAHQLSGAIMNPRRAARNWCQTSRRPRRWTRQ